MISTVKNEGIALCLAMIEANDGGEIWVLRCVVQAYIPTKHPSVQTWPFAPTTSERGPSNPCSALTFPGHPEICGSAALC